MSRQAIIRRPSEGKSVKLAGQPMTFLVTGSDTRHTSMRVLLEENISERRFADWSMGYEPIAASHEPMPEGFRSTFDDLEGDDDTDATRRAVRELTMWFRVRSHRSAS